MMPHFMAYSQLDGLVANRVVVEGHFATEADALAQLRYATRQRHGVITLPQDERIEDWGLSDMEQLLQDAEKLRKERRQLERDLDRVERHLDDVEARIAKANKKAGAA